MAYTKTTWRNNQSPAINADNLNHIEQGVYEAHQDIAENTQNIENLTTQTGANTSAIALEKTQRQQADTAETLARENADNLLSARMDTFTQLPSGSTSGDAELIDIRVGADGVTYPTAGDAVRGQVTDLKSAMNDNTGTSIIEYYKGKYIPNSGSTVDVTDLRSNSAWKCAVIECSEGDIFTISGRGGSETYLYSFVAENGTRLANSGNNANLTDSIVTAPENAKWLVINDLTSSQSFKGILIKKQISDIEGEISDLDDKTDDEINNRKKAVQAVKEFANRETKSIDESLKNKIYNTIYGISPAYSQEVPEGTLQYAKISALGGLTIKSNGDLIPSSVTSIISKNASNVIVDQIDIDTELIDLCDGYGEGVDATYYNEIDFAHRKYIKRAETIELSALTWGGTSVTGLYTATLAGRVYTNNIICSKYQTSDTHHTEDKTIYAKDNNYGDYKIAIYDTDYTNLSDFRASMSGVYLCYPLSTEIVTELPEYLDPLMPKVIENGSITFVNNNSASIPQITEYRIKKPGQSTEELSIFTLDDFEGATLEDKLHNALDTVQNGYILCGEINITKPYVSKSKYYQGIVIVGATFRFGNFEGCWLDTINSAYHNTVIFSNCYFIGHGNTIFADDHVAVVQPKFMDCKFKNISIAKLQGVEGNNNIYLQSLYLLNCDFDQVDVIAEAPIFFDLKLIGCRIEGGTNYGSEVYDTLFKVGEIYQMTITSSLIETRNNKVISARSIQGLIIENCYFENLDDGLLEQTGEGENDRCSLTVSGNNFYCNPNKPVQYMINIHSEKYKLTDGHLVIRENHVRGLNGSMCNRNDCYFYLNNNTKLEAVFDQDGTVKWRVPSIDL